MNEGHFGNETLGLALLAAAAIAGLAWFAWLRPADPAALAAQRLFGERWYAVMFHRTPIGHYHTWSGRDPAGHFAFRTALRFALTSDAETRIEDHLTFHRRRPHRLLTASHTVANEAGPVRSVVVENGVVQVDAAGRRWQTELGAPSAPSHSAAFADRDAARCVAAGGLTLGGYLAVETWLAAGGATAGAVRCARAVDFDRLAVVTHDWRVVAMRDGAVELAKGPAGSPWPGLDGAGLPPPAQEPEVATGVVLDEHFAPRRTARGPLLLLRVADESLARLWQREPPLFADARPGAAVTALIGDASALKRLVLAVEGDAADEEWLHRLAHDGGTGPPRLLTMRVDQRRPATQDEMASALAATLSFPARDPGLRALAGQAVGDAADEDARADALVGFVHGFLRYEDTAGPRDVFAAVRARRGDCTEFADLYTTLARAIGLPARTIVGLAYRPGADGEAGAFAMHAWNEVATEGAWRGVDPTWGQTRVDATHLPIQAEDVLAAAVALPRLRFRVVAADY